MTDETAGVGTERRPGVVAREVSGRDVDVMVIGAGQAGLSAGYFLQRAGFAPETGYLLLDAGGGPGGAWRDRWPTLRLGGVHGIHDLPGLALGEPDPDRPAAEVVADYFGAYERKFDLPVRRPVNVIEVRDRADGRLTVRTDAGEWTARALINATGTWRHPFWPYYPGQWSFAGRQLHTADYRGPAEFAGRRVVVVGGGTSAVQLLDEIAEVAEATRWVTRRPPVFNDGDFTEERGRAAVARVDETVRAGRPPSSVVGVTGLVWTPQTRRMEAAGLLNRLPMFARITPGGVVWPDGSSFDADVIFWCTGFRAVLDHLAPLKLRAPGGGILMDGTRVVTDDRVHLIGYGPSASTIGANRAGRDAVREIRRLLDAAPATLG
ncbi:NAD(P)-binding domain-containing protein [Plantactinospora soyae]|uniref:Cation diffusion facilitator CzcD-associated flavoprotein CzcO n=1 Tax=Plantactinospora soyae TaxID=1544732 RepID=A0A927M3K4_9ACTN|nr:NAD(P)-binding domain-containing protein [Plantactinospora soyae]MBE1487417.1 cation diffusion facilitator CzcD-associated flavoprotein CzcO [Plantactinospora soyae]